MLAAGRITDAIARLSALVKAAESWALEQELERIATMHHLMMQYLAQGVDDPERHKMRATLVEDLYRLTDCCVSSAQLKISTDLYSTRRRMGEGGNFGSYLAQYRQQLNKINLLESVEPASRDTATIATLQREATALEGKMFNAVWVTFPMSEEQTAGLSDFLLDAHTPWTVQCLIISALFLSLNKFYDEGKARVLARVYAGSPHPQVQLRALVALALTLFTYRRRLTFARHVNDLIDIIAAVPSCRNDIQAVFLSLARSRNTGNIGRRLNDELMPDISKLRPGLFKKMRQSDTPIIDITDADANPEWQQWIKDSGIERRLREFNEIQMEGGDVFMTTFAHLKSFPFFNSLSNWFLPFYPTQPDVYAQLGDIVLPRFVDKNPLMCDSDKYSMLFSLASMPADRKEMVRNQLEGAIPPDAAEELEQLHENDRARESIANTYVQDLYRFFHLFSRRNEFYNVFNTSLNLLEVPGLNELVDDEATMALVAEFYLKNGFDDDAITFFSHLLKHYPQSSSHLYQKMGFAHQNQGRFKQAIEQYKRHELVDADDEWTLRHIAACYKALHRPDRALDYYRRALELKPEDVSLCLNVGHCLLQTDAVDEALKFYFRADYLDGDKHRAWAPIAWCSFLARNYEQSERYFVRLTSEGKPSWNALLNYGHLLLVTDRRAQAIDTYVSALSAAKNDHDAFLKQFEDDAPYLVERGLPQEDLPLVMDAVLELHSHHLSS